MRSGGAGTGTDEGGLGRPFRDSRYAGVLDGANGDEGNSGDNGEQDGTSRDEGEQGSGFKICEVSRLLVKL